MTTLLLLLLTCDVIHRPLVFKDVLYIFLTSLHVVLLVRSNLPQHKLEYTSYLVWVMM